MLGGAIFKSIELKKLNKEFTKKKNNIIASNMTAEEKQAAIDKLTQEYKAKISGIMQKYGTIA